MRIRPIVVFLYIVEWIRGNVQEWPGLFFCMFFLLWTEQCMSPLELINQFCVTA
jgi:hypothetical protein